MQDDIRLDVEDVAHIVSEMLRDPVERELPMSVLATG